MTKKKVLSAELPALLVSSGLGAIFWFYLGMQKGLLLFLAVFLLLQLFVLPPVFRKRN
jgi:hypothetical protein